MKYALFFDSKFDNEQAVYSALSGTCKEDDSVVLPIKNVKRFAYIKEMADRMGIGIIVASNPEDCCNATICFYSDQENYEVVPEIKGK